MQQNPMPRDDRERLEQELLGKVRDARNAYLTASREASRIRAKFGEMLDHPDGAAALHHAATRERIAAQAYSAALDAFTNLLLHGRPPAAAAQGES
jgi:Mn-containing catalase